MTKRTLVKRRRRFDLNKDNPDVVAKVCEGLTAGISINWLTALLDFWQWRLGRFKKGVWVMFPFWVDLELSQFSELITSSFVAMATTVSWLCFSGRP